MKELKRYVLEGSAVWAYEKPEGATPVEGLTPREELKLLSPTDSELDWAKARAEQIYSEVDVQQGRVTFLEALYPGLIREYRHARQFDKEPKRIKLKTIGGDR